MTRGEINKAIRVVTNGSSFQVVHDIQGEAIVCHTASQDVAATIKDALRQRQALKAKHASMAQAAGSSAVTFKKGDKIAGRDTRFTYRVLTVHRDGTMRIKALFPLNADGTEAECGYLGQTYHGAYPGAFYAFPPKAEG